MRAGPNRDLLSGPIGRTLLLFSLPTLASSALQSASGSLNTLWVGRFLGEAALAATANGNIVMFLLVAFVFGFGMASTIYIGQAWGRGDVDEARRVAGTAIGAFVPIAARGWIAAPWLLNVLGTSEPVAPLALAYLRVVFLAMPAMMMFTLLTMALTGTGDSTTPMWFIGASVLIDSALNPLFIVGIGPFPTLGIAGAGLATVIAQYVSLGAMLLWIYARNLPLPIAGRIIRLSTWGFVAFGVALVVFGTVRATGQVVAPLLILAFSMYPVRLGFAIGAYRWLGADAIWWSFPIALVVAMILALAFYRLGGWRYGKLLPLSPHECEQHARCARETTGALAPAA